MSNPNKNAVDLINLIKDKFAMRKDIAPVETSSTASRAYKVGDKFYYGNLLQKATQDIAQGTGLAGGVNFENADPVTEQVTSLKETLTNQINVNGSKNLLPLNPPLGIYYGITVAKSSNYWTADGTASASPTAFSLLSPVFDTIPNCKVAIENTGIDMSKTYRFSRQAKVNGLRYNFRLYNGSTLLLESTLNDSNNLYLDIDMSQYPTATHIAMGLEITNGTVLSLSAIKPMLSLVSDYDLDSMYEPYAMTNQQLTKETTGLIDNQNVNGAVNELENNNVTNVQTETTFTVNSDKTVTVTVASTTSAPRSMEFPFNFKKGTYKLTGNPVKDDAHIKMTFYNQTDAQNIATDFGHGAVFTINGTKRCSVYIDLRTGTPAGTYVFKPMISLASLNLSYDDYVPYAKSNRELTELTKVSTANYTSTTYGIGLALSKVGRVITAQVIGDVTQAIAKNTTVYTLPEEARPSQYGLFFWVVDQNTMDSSSDQSVQLLTKGYINTNGKVSTGAIANGAKPRSQMFSYIAANDTPLS